LIAFGPSLAEAAGEILKLIPGRTGQGLT